MRVCYLHYHLKPGGVTSVIRQQVQAVGKSCETLVLADGVPDEDLGTEVVSVPWLAYDSEREETVSAEKLADAVLNAIRSKWPSGCDILHIHNPTLVKNRQLLPAIEILRDAGCPCFLQIHDFAEDGRPHLCTDHHYPKDIPYGVINSRDRDLLIEAGLDPEGVYLIANTVHPWSFQKEPGRGYVLYPVRALRRKNIGECILLSLLIGPDQTVGVTLPPYSSPDLQIFESWCAFAGLHDLNIRFNLSLRHPYPELMSESVYTLTTSVNEGFGFTFLEPWTAGKMVHGRRLPHVCEDFERHGLRLDHLYDALLIPRNSFASETFHQSWRRAIMNRAEAFRIRLDPDDLDRTFERLYRSECVDFGLLDEGSQMQVLSCVIEDASLRKEIQALNPWIEQWHPSDSDRDVIAHNDRIVRKFYGLEAYGTQLIDLYRSVRKRKVRHAIKKDVLIRFFLDPERFRMMS